jgi:hypothetical protein
MCAEYTGTLEAQPRTAPLAAPVHGTPTTHTPAAMPLRRAYGGAVTTSPSPVSSMLHPSS